MGEDERHAPEGRGVAVSSATRLQFFYDFTSPYTYLASTQIDALGARHGIVVEWEPALLGGIMKATGNTPPAALPPRAAFMLADVVRWATIYGVPFRFSEHFPHASMPALRAAIAVRKNAPESFAKYNTLMFRATWAEGKNIADKGVLAEVATAAGVSSDLVLGANDDPACKAELKASTERAVALGAFGLPFVVLDQDGAIETYFGNDRLPMLDERLRRGKPWPLPPGVEVKL